MLPEEEKAGPMGFLWKPLGLHVSPCTLFPVSIQPPFVREKSCRPSGFTKGSWPLADCAVS